MNSDDLFNDKTALGDGTCLDDVAAWREVHATLLKAVQTARDAVAILKMQRRYWLEEIAWNLDDSGRVASHSVWKQPICVAQKPETNSKRKSIGQAVKRKKTSPHSTEKSGSSQKEPKRQKKNADGASGGKKTPKIILKRSEHHSVSAIPSKSQAVNQEFDSAENYELDHSKEEIVPVSGVRQDFPGGQYVQDASYHREIYPASSPTWDDPDLHDSRPALFSSAYPPPQSFVATSGVTVPVVPSTQLSVPTFHQTHPIRNYTSLQDIAMNDESDEDRF